MGFTHSGQQLAIFDWFSGTLDRCLLNGRRNGLVRGRAGVGKTYALMEGASHALEESILYTSFAKRNIEDVKPKIKNPAITAATLHSVGRSIIVQQWSKMLLDDDRGFRLARKVAGDNTPDAVVLLIKKLAAHGKNMAPFADVGALIDIGYAMDTLPTSEQERNGWTLERVAGLAVRSMTLAASRDGTMDFDDMCFIPVRNRWTSEDYELVMVDECFPGTTPVLLADGSTKTIQEIVDGRLPVTVMSYDTNTRMTVPKRVTNWKRILRRKPMVRVITREVLHDKNGRRLSPNTERVRCGTRTLVCTEDHQFFTERKGWVPASTLRRGDALVLENAAPRDTAYNNRYKHGAEGKEALRASLDMRRDTLPRGVNASGPSVRGGNGRPLTVPQQTLLDALGAPWVAEYSIPTGKARNQGYPTAYKVDLANPACRVVVELDGGSHHNPKARAKDLKKARLLRALGWRIFRFTNSAAFNNTAKIVAMLPKTCLTETEVVLVEPYEIPDYYVYDLTVEDTHCYFAHGILVHNCQDMNATQIALALSVVTRDGRVLVIGDDRQAIYGFRGADSNSLDRLKTELNAYEMSLTTTYRCPKSVVDLAKKLVPDYVAADAAQDGLVRTMPTIEQMMDDAQPGDFILSRANAPLMKCCLGLLRRGKRAKIEGRDVGKGLLTLIRNLRAGSMQEMLRKLSEWQNEEIARASQRLEPHKAEARIEFVNDQASTLRDLSEHLNSVGELEARIVDLFTETTAAARSTMTVLSSVHKSKGLEAPRVFLLAETFYSRGESLEERNIEYVAITRVLGTADQPGSGVLTLVGSISPLSPAYALMKPAAMLASPTVSSDTPVMQTSRPFNCRCMSYTDGMPTHTVGCPHYKEPERYAGQNCESCGAPSTMPHKADCAVAKLPWREYVEKEMPAAFVEFGAAVVPTNMDCSVCGKPQFDTPAGEVCAEGHGGAPGVARNALATPSAVAVTTTPDAFTLVAADAIEALEEVELYTPKLTREQRREKWRMSFTSLTRRNP